MTLTRNVLSARRGSSSRNEQSTIAAQEKTLRVAPTPSVFLRKLFRVDLDVSSMLEVSRLEIIDADTQRRLVYRLNGSYSC